MLSFYIHSYQALFRQTWLREIKALLTICLLFAFVLCFIPHTIRAQATIVGDTLTINGTKFAPGVMVFVGGRQVEARYVNRINARLLKVFVPKDYFSQMGVAGSKDGGSSLNSAGIAVVVQNPTPTNGTGRSNPWTVYAKPTTYSLAFIQGSSQDTLSSLRMRVPLSTESDTIIRMRYSGLPQGTKQLQFQLGDTTFFQVYDSVNRKISSMTITNQAGIVSFRVRFKSSSTLPTNRVNQDIVLTARITNMNTTLVQKQLNLHCFPVQSIRILTAYTAHSSEVYYLADGVKDSLRNSALFLRGCLQTLNANLDTLQDSGEISKLVQTRFIFIESPIYALSHNENRPEKHIHSDIDALKGNMQRSNIPEIANRQSDNSPVLLLVNSEAAAYKAIASSCDLMNIPQYIVVEAKHAKNYIDVQNNSVNSRFIDMLKTVIK